MVNDDTVVNAHNKLVSITRPPCRERGFIDKLSHSVYGKCLQCARTLAVLRGGSFLSECLAEASGLGQPFGRWRQCCAHHINASIQFKAGSIGGHPALAFAAGLPYATPCRPPCCCGCVPGRRAPPPTF